MIKYLAFSIFLFVCLMCFEQAHADCTTKLTGVQCHDNEFSVWCSVSFPSNGAQECDSSWEYRDLPTYYHYPEPTQPGGYGHTGVQQSPRFGYSV